MLGAEHGQQTRACGANRQSRAGRRHGEQRRFDDELYQHAIAAGADRLPDGELLRPRADPDHQQVGKIDDANRQQHDRAGLHEEQRAPDRRDVMGVKRRHDRSEAGVGHLLRRRDSCAPSPRCAHRSAPARPAASTPGFRRRDHVHRVARVPPIGPAILRAGGEREIQPGLRRQESIAGRQDADHRVPEAVRRGSSGRATARSALKCCRQYASVRMTTRADSERMSSSVNARPIAGATPSVAKKSGDTCVIHSRSVDPGSPTMPLPSR